MGTWKDCARGMLANSVQVEGESLERYFKRTRQLCSEADVYGDNDMRWVVRAFINGLADDRLQSAMQALRRRRQSMTLGEAYGELMDLAAPRGIPNSDCSSGHRPVVEAGGTGDELSMATLIPVHYLSQDVSSDPVAFGRFFTTHRARPYYQSSGPFSRRSIEKLHACYTPPLADYGKVAGVANAGPAWVAIGRASTSYTLGNLDQTTQDVCAMGPMGDSTDPVQTSGGEGKEEKRIDQDSVRNEREVGLDASMVILDMETEDLEDDLIGIGMVTNDSEGTEREVDWAKGLRSLVLLECGERVRNAGNDNLTSADERESSGGPHNSEDLTIDTIRSPSTIPFQTTSEWDPGPGTPIDAIPAIDKDKDSHLLTSSDIQVMVPVVQNPNGIVLRTTPRDPAHPVAEYLWPPEFGAQPAYHRNPMVTVNTRLGQYCLSSWSWTKRAAGVGSACRGNGGNSDNRRKITQVVAETRTGERAQNTSINALFPAMTGPDLRGRIGGRQIWDPGGGKAESLNLAERCMHRRENRAGRSTPENEKEELAGRQAFGF